jgi:phosphate transport system protein
MTTPARRHDDASLRKALDAFARLVAWTRRALEAFKQDDQINQEFDGLLRKLITYMKPIQRKDCR